MRAFSSSYLQEGGDAGSMCVFFCFSERRWESRRDIPPPPLPCPCEACLPAVAVFDVGHASPRAPSFVAHPGELLHAPVKSRFIFLLAPVREGGWAREAPSPMNRGCVCLQSRGGWVHSHDSSAK